LNKSSINLRILLPKNDNESPPTIVISNIEIIISTPGILNGK